MAREDILKEIRSFKETKNLEFSDADLLTIYNYVLEKKAFIENKKTGYEPVLKSNPYRIELVPSDKLNEQLKLQEKRERIDTLLHKNYITEATLDGFDTFNLERQTIITVAKDFVDRFSEKSYVRGLYIYGKNRTGKTYILSAIANALAEKGIKSMFVYVPDLVRSMRDSIDDGSLEVKIKQLKNCDLLILDDIGSSFLTPWFRDEILGSVIQHRLNLGLPVLFSSNLDIKTLTSYLVDPKSENDKINAVRIVTRITEMAQPLKLSDDAYKK